jgi:hypothetical protein
MYFFEKVWIVKYFWEKESVYTLLAGGKNKTVKSVLQLDSLQSIYRGYYNRLEKNI